MSVSMPDRPMPDDPRLEDAREEETEVLARRWQDSLSNGELVEELLDAIGEHTDDRWVRTNPDETLRRQERLDRLADAVCAENPQAIGEIVMECWTLRRNERGERNR